MSSLPHSLPPNAPSVRRGRTITTLLFFLALLLWGVVYLMHAQPVQAAGNLQVEIVAGYNLVVDSNVTSPSTYAPSVATVMGRFCNTGDAALTNVEGFIGNYTGAGPVGGTPGIYPARNSTDGAFAAQHPHLANTGNYAFTHIGGRIGTADATRYIGTLNPGQCRVQYWHMTYPACANTGGGTAVLPPCTTTPVWGITNVDSDDLWLEFDIWGRSAQGSGSDTTWRMTMRNEISAMANKIKPNPSGQWFNTNTAIVNPGDTITSNGILYTLGNVRQGFDNDGNFTPDYNAWLQPVGDPSYDPSCFRLIGTTGVLTVTRSGGNPPMYINFTDQLYFTYLPPDNTGVTGEVRYTFLALDGPCNTALSPYQEVASGFNNEKFNGDYGVGVPPVMSYEPQVTIDKTSSPNVIPLGGTITYQIPLFNGGNTGAGLPLSTGGPSLVISDTIPAGMVYVAGSASANVGVTIRYFDGSVWTLTEPPAADVRAINWMLNDTLAPNQSATGTFQATVPLSYVGTPFIINTACASFGNGVAFACDEAMNLVQGTHTIGDFVWRDLNNNGLQDGGAETGIANIDVSLYWDANNNGILDDTDVFVRTTSTNGSGNYSFTQLPVGNYLVKVHSDDPQMPVGYRHTTPEVHVVTNLNSNYVLADFGFGPSLSVNKVAFSGPDRYEGQAVNYGITVSNLRPGTGQTVGGSCVYELWPAEQATANAPKNFTNAFQAVGAPDGLYASGDFAIGSGRWIRVGGFDAGTRSGTITSVQALIPLYVSATLTDDSLSILLKNSALTELGNTPFSTAVLNTRVGPANASNLVWTIPGAIAPGGSWDWTDFAQLWLELQPTKVGGADASVINLDGMGFRITVSNPCPPVDGNDILTTVPLTDTYNTTYLEFVSANPAPTSVDTVTGLISWANVGPIAPSENKLVTVQFMARNIDDITISNIINYAGVTGATFADGGAANNGSDTATINILPTGTINGTVFSDQGTVGWPYLPGTDLPLAGVQVTLYGCFSNATDDIIATPAFTNQACESAQNNGQWRVVGTRTTNASGFYEFVGLLNGYYYVQVNSGQLPGTVTQTAEPLDTQTTTGTLPNTTANGQTCGTCNSIWGTPTANMALANFNPINSPGETINGVNFGYNINPGVYGVIWEDINGNGLRGTDEPMIQPVTVRLYGTSDCSGPVLQSNVTVAGRYQFGNLTAGTTYCIAVDTAAMPAVPGGSWTQTGETDGTVNNRITFTAVAGTLSGSHDFGFRRIGSQVISGNVYADWNSNADFEGLDTGFGGIPVTLYASNGTIIATTTTAADGSYSFPGLASGTYSVVVDESFLPAQYTQTENYGENNGSGFCTLCNGRASVTLTGTSISGVDFGYQPAGYGTIGDRVWRDNNGDGYQGSIGSEPGIANITVRLYVDYGDGSGYVMVRTTSTNASGLYSFINLPPGNYRVEVDTADPDLPTDGSGNRFVPTTPVTVNAALAATQTYLEADFGFTRGGVIGDYIWQDDNGDGVQDLGEPPLSGVMVELQNGVCTPSVNCPTATTNVNGIYEFTGLPAGTYTVRVLSGVPAGFIQTGDPDLTTPCSGLTCDGQSTVPLYAGQIDRSRDFGYQPAVVIGDYVWVDQNNDGIQDANEAGIGGVQLTLNLQGGGTRTTTTNSDGYYTFGNVPNGTHSVTINTGTLPAGLVPTYDLDGTDTAHTTAVLVNNAMRLDVDFGYQYSGTFSIGGVVFYDTNNNGSAPESGDPTYPGVVVTLWRNGQIVAQTVTGSNGRYLFPNLPAGNYTVSLNSSDPALLGHNYNTPLLNTGPVYETIVGLNSNVSDVDFGFWAPVGPTAVTLQGAQTAAASQPLYWLLLATLLLGLFTIPALRRHGGRA